MVSKLYFILLLIVGSALAVPTGQRPWTRSGPHCRKACSMTDLQKMRFQEGKTYEYELMTESMVKINQLNEQAKISWSGMVELHFETPCEVTVSIKDPRVDGQSYPQFTKEITEYPLRATLSDGIVEEVCVDPRDFNNAVNIKKGILSQLQNSLPSNSSMYSGMSFTETDVVGVCPTNYTVKREGNNIVVEKMKEHRLCSERYSYGSVSAESAMFLKSPIPLKTSQSKCTQVIEQGIVKSVKCRDETEMTPTLGVQKHIMAELKSSLVLKSVDTIRRVPELSRVRLTKLWYDFSVSARNSSAIPEMEVKLRELLHSVQNKMKVGSTSEIYSDLIKLMNQVPEETIKNTLDKIKSGSFGNKEMLEKLYLDAVGSTTNNGAIAVMVEQMQQKQRRFEYTTSMFTFPRVCEHGLRQVKPLFRDQEMPYPTILAAGSLVGTYCKTEGSLYICESVPEVKEIMREISQEIRSSLTSVRSDDKASKRVIALLKAIGNIRRMDDELRSTVLSILEDKHMPSVLRVAAADSLKRVPCKEEATKKMLRVAKDFSQDTDVRIFSYKASIQCANMSAISSLLDVITVEPNEQVRSYILSDLTNLQQSKNPEKVEIMRKLAPFVITQTFSRNLFNNSLYKESSRFAESKILGEELGLDIIYESARMLPKEIRTNFTMSLFKEISNVAEMGVRFEHLQKFMTKIFKQGTYLGDSGIGQILRHVGSTDQQNNEPGKIDYFLRLFGKEVFYSRVSSQENFEKELFVELYEMMGKVYFKLMSGANLERVKGFQIRYDLHVPTIQGIPLIVTADFSSVATFQAKPTPTESPLYTIVEINPIVSGVLKTFVGYNFGASAGFKSKTHFKSVSDVIFTLKIENNSFMTKLEIPQNVAEVMEVKMENYLMVRKPSQAEQKIPSSRSEPRITGKDKCKKIGTLGLKMCVEYDIPDILRATDLPLVKPVTLKVIIQKINPSVKSVQLSINRNTNERILSAKLEVPGTSQPTKFDAKLKYDLRNNEKKQMSLVMRTSDDTRGFKIIQDTKVQGRSVEIKLEAFSGLTSVEQSGQKVLSTVLKTDEMRASLQMKTMGSLRQNFTADVDVRAALVEGRFTKYEVDIEKFEVVLATMKYRTENYIRKTPSSDSTKYDSQFLLKRDERAIFKMLSAATVKSAQKEAQVSSKIEWEAYSSHYFTKFEMRIKPGDNMLLVDIEKDQSQKVAVLQGACLTQGSSSTEQRRTLLSLEIPKENIKWKIEANFNSLPDSNESSRDLDIKIKNRDSVMLSLRGPFTMIWTESYKKIDSSIGIKGASNEVSYNVATKFEKTREKQSVKLVVNKEKSLLLDYNHEIQLNAQETSVSGQMRIPEQIQAELQLKHSESETQVTADIIAPIVSPRHLKGHLSLNRERDGTTFSSKLQWDLERNPMRLITLRGSLKEEDEGHRTLQGEYTYERQRYTYDISYFLKKNGWRNIEKDLLVHIRNSTGEFINFRSSHMVSIKSKHNFNIDCHLALKTPSGKTYRLQSLTEASYPQESLKLKSDIALSSPSLGNIESKFLLNPVSSSERDIQGSFVRLHKSPEMKLDYHGKAIMNAERRLEKADLEVRGSIGQKSVALIFKEESEKTELIVMKDQVVELKVDSIRTGTSKIMVDVTSSMAKMSLSARYDQHEKSITIMPDTQNWNKKIEMKIQHDSPTSKRMRVEYPHGGHQKSIEGKWTSGSPGQGQLEMNVMAPQGTKLMSIFITSHRLSTNSSRYIVQMVSKNRVKGPELTVDTTFSASEKSIVTSYKKMASLPSSVVLQTKYVKESPISGMASVLFSSPQGKIELGGKVHSIETFNAQGFSLNSTIQMTGSEPYVMDLMVSKPAFMKIIVGRKLSEDRYVTKIGLESYTHAEISFMNNRWVKSNEKWTQMSGETKEIEELPLMALSAKLQKPVTLSLRTQFNQDRIERTKSLLRTQFESAKNELSKYFSLVGDQMAKEIEEKIPEVKQAYDEIKKVLTSLKESEYFQKASEYLNKLYEDSVTAMKYMNKIVMNLYHTIKKSYDSFMDAHKTIRDEMNKIVKGIAAKIREALNISKGDYDVVRALFASAQKSLESQVEKRCRYEQDTCKLLRQTLADALVQVKKDATSIYKFLLRDTSVAYAKSLLRRHVDMMANEKYFQLVESALVTVSPQSIGIMSSESGIQVNLPLTKPLGSVLYTPMYVGFKMPEFFRTWATVDSNEIFRVDGRKIFFPTLQCDYYLAKQNQSRAVLIAGKMTSDDYYQKTMHGKHVVKAEINRAKLLIDGHPVDLTSPRSYYLEPQFYVYTMDKKALIRNHEIVLIVDFNFKTVVGHSTTDSFGIVFDKFNLNTVEDYRRYKVISSCKEN